MPNVGPTEVLILLTVLVAAPASLVTVIAVRAHRRNRTPPRSPMPQHNLSPSQLQQHVMALLAADRLILAVKVVRDQTGLDLKSAKRYVDDLRAGRTPHPDAPRYGDAMIPSSPPPTAPGHDADLATRVRRLKAAGRQEQAVLLVRGETGMSEPDAQHFVESLHN